MANILRAFLILSLCYLNLADEYRHGKFLFESRTTTVTSFTSTTTVTVTNTASCFTTEDPAAGAMITQCAVGRRRRALQSLLSEEPLQVELNGDKVDYNSLVKPSKTSKVTPALALEPSNSDASGNLREGRALFGPIVVLSKSTTNVVSTAVMTADNAATVTVTFAGCTPADVMQVIGPACA
ncbi:uncharacterized protein LOC131881766 [Tigriopus californicus]|uniref:uncharacterized protein LOC131881766 n=1 Tax=Tigriopus californicus TaxID=6832 RepID=UPI0027DA32A4|nr:uncharacterized protein LOC131881766 [Tigriopus californicus]